MVVGEESGLLELLEDARAEASVISGDDIGRVCNFFSDWFSEGDHVRIVDYSRVTHGPPECGEDVYVQAKLNGPVLVVEFEESSPLVVNAEDRSPAFSRFSQGLYLDLGERKRDLPPSDPRDEVLIMPYSED